MSSKPPWSIQQVPYQPVNAETVNCCLKKKINQSEIMSLLAHKRRLFPVNRNAGKIWRAIMLHIVLQWPRLTEALHFSV